MNNNIIDIIEPFEELILIYQKLIKTIKKIFSLISELHSQETNEKLISYFNFVKGVEVSDSNRTNNNNNNSLVPYIRVADLSVDRERQTLYCNKINNSLCNYKDILVATDGDPGRINIGLNGVFSSSIRKIIPKDTSHLSIALLNLFNVKNKNIFNAYTTGTTIKHGGNKAIPNLKYFEYHNDIKNFVKYLYEILTNYQKNQTKVNNLRNLLINKLIK